MSRLVVMGSGETAPTMVRHHRELFADTPDGPAVMLDTPFAFQTNRAELVARTRLYFAQSVGREVEVVSWPAPDSGAGERALSLLDRATWVFAGPGSPTYALRQWHDTPVPAALAAVVRRGGTLVMGSAAAVTLGSHAVPVYEIYKVGAEPQWVAGLDLLHNLAGLRAAVVPHYDNREGATHDTRFCYLGEQRLAALEAQLPDEVGVLGVDEHTAVVLDLAHATARVLGNGALSLRHRGVTVTARPGAEVGLDAVDGLLRGTGSESGSRPTVAAGTSPPGPEEPGATPSLRAETERARADFSAAMDARDVRGAVGAILSLEAAMAAWSADTLQGSDLDEARRVLRALVVGLGELAERGVRDPREAAAPYVELLLELRAAARESRDFTLSDEIRDRLEKAGVEVRDTPEGGTWDLRGT